MTVMQVERCSGFATPEAELGEAEIVKLATVDLKTEPKEQQVLAHEDVEDQVVPR